MARAHGFTAAIAGATAAVMAGVPAVSSAEVSPPSSAGAQHPDVVRAPQWVAVRDPKVAVVGSSVDLVGSGFTVVDGTGTPVLAGTLSAVPSGLDGEAVDTEGWARMALADFSALVTPGTYRVRAGNAVEATVTVAQEPYAGVLSSLLSIYNVNADGRESTFHRPSHLRDAHSAIANGPRRGTRVDVAGGWMDSGDQLKFTVTIAYATSMLQLAARSYPAGASSLRKIADIGVRWLLKAHPRRDVFVSQVGNADVDHNSGFRDPVRDDASSTPALRNRPSSVLTPATGGADVAAAASAALAIAAQRAGGDRRAVLIRAARAWLVQALALGRPWRNDFYGQTSWRDDVAMARVELGAAAGVTSQFDQALVDLEATLTDGGPGGTVQGWEVLADGFEMAAMPLARLCGVLGGPLAVRAVVRDRACELLRLGAADVEYKARLNAFGRPAPYSWGTTRGVAAGSLTALLGGRAGAGPGEAMAVRGVGWLLGANPWGRRWQAGFGVQRPYHWAQITRGGAAPVGALVGGPAPVADITANALPGNPYAPGLFDTAAVGYRDSGRDYVTNEVGIPYSAPAVLLSALLASR
ncbi:glycoside hydrolase family 9 protein [Nocardioides sp. R-C-SC26]|uniref:glycoside hydrolase family 9 protein n=1 Tax=Nocardioides sp. R-C-SC26 TaxID=2870414 RepID=UPI001E296A76|nr:glycoside hydrolase family 9 protein [Nocardioides sp. R-C-SC26]